LGEGRGGNKSPSPPKKINNIDEGQMSKRHEKKNPAWLEERPCQGKFRQVTLAKK